MNARNKKEVDISEKIVLGLSRSTDAEKLLLGSILIEESELDLVSGFLAVGDFYEEKHRIIYKEMLDMKDSQLNIVEAIEVSNLKVRLQRLNKLELAGGENYLYDLIANEHLEFNSVIYANTIRDNRIRRDFLRVSEALVTSAKNPTKDPSSTITEIIQRLADLDSSSFGFNIEELSLSKIVQAALAAQNESEINGMQTGYKYLDEAINGLKAGNLMIIAGRPAMGKSTFALNICENLIFKGNDSSPFKKNEAAPVLIFTLEMPAVQLAERILSNGAGISQSKIQKRKCSSNDIENLGVFVKQIQESNCKMYIDDSHKITIERIRSLARTIKSQHNNQLAAIMIDYLQLIHTDLYKDQRHLQIGYISGALKALARELEVPVIALAQLNREVEKMAGAKPNNSHLRESGSIEQDADIICMVHRPEIYEVDPARKAELKGKAEIIITKNRQGKIGTVNLRFEGEYSRFVSDDSMQGFIDN